jgi:hypothetical protein
VRVNARGKVRFLRVSFVQFRWKFPGGRGGALVESMLVGYWLLVTFHAGVLVWKKRSLKWREVEISAEATRVPSSGRHKKGE